MLKLLVYPVVLILGLALTDLHAQSVVLTSGASPKGATGSVSYSIGQITYQNFEGSNGHINQGVQQPFEIFFITGEGNSLGNGLQIFAYPNPARESLVLQVDDYERGNITYQLFDILGNRLKSEKITGRETSIIMSSKTPGVFLLMVFEKGRALKTFKIIKH